MNIEFYDVNDIKDKFGDLLSILYHDAKVGIDNINEKMISSEFLDIFEQNNLREFMDTPNERIVQQLFPKLFVFYNEKKDVGPFYWSGIQYMNIFLNYRIPLKTLFVICPLKMMVEKYDVYHEMNEIKLCENIILERFEKVSLLKYFRLKRKLSVAKLSVLSHIPNSTIRYYESDNKRFLNAPTSSLQVLSNILGICWLFLRKTSTFVPVLYSLLTDEDFQYYLCKNLSQFIGKEIKEIEICFDKESIGEKEKNYLVINDHSSVVTNKKQTFLEDPILLQILSNAYDQYLLNNLDSNLVF